MSYTREQAEEMSLDWNEFHFGKRKICSTDQEFITHKFGAQLEAGRWYRDTTWQIRIKILEVLKNKVDGGYIRAFGVGSSGMWNERGTFYYDLDRAHRELVPMTDDEVLDFLTEQAKERYKEGDMARSVLNGRDYTIELKNHQPEIQHCFFCYGRMNVLNLETGEWAEVIDKNAEIKATIKELEDKIQELKNQIQ